MSTIMNAETGLPPLPERFDYTNSSAYWCYSRYTMTRDDLGDYVLAEDYDALRNASEALQAEIEALRAEAELWRHKAAIHKYRRERLAEALEEIRSRSSIDLAMRSDQFELTARLGDIYQIADAALEQEAVRE